MRQLAANSDATYWRNQGNRRATCLAVIGDRALIVYGMPSGVDYLNIVLADGSDEPCTAKQVSPKSLSKKWRAAVAVQYGRPVGLGIKRGGQVVTEWIDLPGMGARQ